MKLNNVFKEILTLYLYCVCYFCSFFSNGGLSVCVLGLEHHSWENFDKQTKSRSYFFDSVTPVVTNHGGLSFFIQHIYTVMYSGFYLQTSTRISFVQIKFFCMFYYTFILLFMLRYPCTWHWVQVPMLKSSVQFYIHCINKQNQGFKTFLNGDQLFQNISRCQQKWKINK